MYENFGAVVKESLVTFKVFFPDNAIDTNQYQRGGLPKIQSLKVTGNFQSKIKGVNWDVDAAPELKKRKHKQGWIYQCQISNIQDGFYEYKYFVTFENKTTRWCSDPCSKYGGFDNENSGFVVGGNQATVQPLANRLPSEELVIYEMMLDDFTAEYRDDRAPLDAVLDKLDYLQNLGINAIEFMPWTSWPKGEFSWGYDPVSFFSVEFNYYNDDTQPLDKLFRLQKLINELHRRNMHVIMDGVFNHARAGIDPNKGFAYFWLYQNPEDSPFIGSFGEGGFFNEFDFANNCTNDFITDACKYWLNEYSIDGIRFDYVKGFYEPGNPDQGIGKIISYLKNFTKAKRLSNITFTLELLPDNRYEAVEETNQINANGCWFDPLMWESASVGTTGILSTRLMRALHAGKDFAPGKRPVIYLENHDHSTLTEWYGGRQHWYKTQPAIIALFTICGAVFIHNGQEYGEQYLLPEDGEGRVLPRPLHWALSNDDISKSLYALYKKMGDVRKENPALLSVNFYPDVYSEIWSAFNAEGYGADVLKQVVIYHRWGNNKDGKTEKYIIALNFSDDEQSVTLPFSDNGKWKDLLSDTEIIVTSFKAENFVLHSNWGVVFKLLN